MIEWYKRDGKIVNEKYDALAPEEYRDNENIKVWTDNGSGYMLMICDDNTGEHFSLVRLIEQKDWPKEYRLKKIWYKQGGIVVNEGVRFYVPTIWRNYPWIDVQYVHEGVTMLRITKDGVHWQMVHGNARRSFA